MLPNEPVTQHFRLQDVQKRALKRLKIETLRDLLYHVPARYERAGDHKTIAGLVAGQDTILYGTLRKPEARKSWKSRRPMSEAWLEDGTGKVKLMWFNQPYIAKMYGDGLMVKVSGKVEGTASLYIANPEVEQVSALPLGGTDTVFSAEGEDELFAVYPETKGITSRWFRHAITKVIRAHVHEHCDDPIEHEILARYHLPTLSTALLWIHEPRTKNDATSARKRFAFEEVFVIHVAKQLDRQAFDREPSVAIPDVARKAQEFIARLPFAPTAGQRSAIDAILGDMAQPPAMSRLLEGDVGSGKTAVAATTAYAVVTSAPAGRPSATLQVAYMAPTEILAEQHFTSFCELFGHLPIQIGLMTGSVCRKFPSKTDPKNGTRISKAQLLKWVANGEIAILIGTHALIEKKVQFRDLAYVIIDEQHRFGTGQRQKLVRKDGIMPHLLSMTATPIPRTLALTVYGDLDLTVLDEMPPGRKRVITEVVGKTGRVDMYTALRCELDAGRQAYVICPRIDEPDPRKEMAVQTKSVLAEADRLKRQELKGYRIGVLHGQMKPTEKDTAMRALMAHQTDVLVATSVVEVGVNVPNATVIVIEGAERFGLAQLHQLRGRVVRSTHQAYCYVLSSEGNTTTRLKALAKAKSGFELSELDLKIRGPGELYGRSQSGLTDLGMEALKNLKMIEAARTEAQRVAHEDLTLARHPILAHAVEGQREKLHFE
ncbi:MAG: ATP-dependent DNA helicase RecG [Candidatus Pacebacteria bacterium]|nr:ATP-dependent DNA helicase RecG [Candidatus Paceibacterota bacterium]